MDIPVTKNCYAMVIRTYWQNKAKSMEAGMSQIVASIIWLNYNSMKFINVIKRSLKSIYEISLPLELIVVDNASTDGSFEEILSYLDGLEERDFKVKVIRLSKNMGYTGGNNMGYLNSDPRTNYIAFINNDFIICEGSMEHIISYLDVHKDVGIAQGTIYDIMKRTWIMLVSCALRRF